MQAIGWTSLASPLAAQGLTLLTPPSGEPLSLAEAKGWLRVDLDDDAQDAEILGLIEAAREEAEQYSARQLVSAQWRLTLPYFPPCGWLVLPRPPLQGVASVSYYDASNALQTLASSYYDVNVTPEQGTLSLAYTSYWPVTYLRPDAVRIDFWCGHGPSTETTTGFEAGTRTITPTSMNGIYAGTELLVGDGAERERIVVTSVASTTFTATFARGHPDPVPILPALPRRVRQGMLALIAGRYVLRGDEKPGDLEKLEECGRNLIAQAWAGGWS